MWVQVRRRTVVVVAPASGQIPLRYPARESRAGYSVMEFGLYTATVSRKQATIYSCLQLRVQKTAYVLNQSINQFFIISCHTATNTSIMPYVRKVQQD